MFNLNAPWSRATAAGGSVQSHPGTRRRNRSPLRRTARRLMAASLALALALSVGPEIAAAGTNGQQIYVYGSQQYSVTICGYNQYNNYVCGSGNTPNYITYFPGGWWKTFNGRNVTIYNYRSYNEQGYLGASSCYVPTSQASNWIGCHGWG